MKKYKLPKWNSVDQVWENTIDPIEEQLFRDYMEARMKKSMKNIKDDDYPF